MTNASGRSDLKSVWARLACCLSKGTLKRYFSYIYLTTLLEVRNFGNTLAMIVVFFLGICSKFTVYLKNREKNSEKHFLLLR